MVGRADMAVQFSEYPPEFAYVDPRPLIDDIGVRLTFALVDGFKAPSQIPLQVDRFAEQPLRWRGLRDRLVGEKEKQADGAEPACARSCATPLFAHPKFFAAGPISAHRHVRLLPSLR